ncbi:unnamed protein product [Orchesella dallaii]|uniref:Right handed beta helix domain-containing protein n=1 Tax=Orchesella dallaii TaxID=48710 RepID=A0ABP1R4U3_9HEXA
METRKPKDYDLPTLKQPSLASLWIKKANKIRRPYAIPAAIMLCLVYLISLLIYPTTAREIHVSASGKGVIASEHVRRQPLAKRNLYTNATSSNPLTSSDLTWFIDNRECGQLDEGCFCETKPNRNRTSIRCRCDNETQVAHLKPPGLGPSGRRSSADSDIWIWKFEQCSKLILHSNFLSVMHGSQFQVEFNNIPTLVIHEFASAAGGIYSSHVSPNKMSISFNQCNIERVPTKTFPSFVNNIKFSRCNIKTLAPRFVRALTMDKVTIEHSKVVDIESDAFNSQTIIDSLHVEDTTISRIHTAGVASAMNKMLWLNSKIDFLEQDALNGSVATATLQNSEFTNVETNGFSLISWSRVIIINNTFTDVARRGIDLSRGDHNHIVEILDNSWEKVERDFISTGADDTPFISVKDNVFLQQCDCGNTFASYVTMNGSRRWFHEELLNNSRCPVSEEVLECLLVNEHINSTETNLLPYESLNLLCDSQVYMCINGVSEVGVDSEIDDETVPGRPQLPNRLRVLAYFIAAMGMFIIVSLIITMCVFLCRRKTPKKKSPPDSPLQDLEHAQGKKTVMSKSMSGGEYADIVFKHQNSGGRPRSMLLEDVEMEDKGVQTMPTELSNEVLEGLREKLSRPDSFWDAKETIDHLYDLIQVKELNSGLSSPPDVTMCNGQSTTASTARLLPSTSSSPVAQVTSAGVSVSIGGSDPIMLQTINTSASNVSSPVSDTPPPLPSTSPPSGMPQIQRYAQIRNKAKTSPLCEYADPSDSSMHIYSELTPNLETDSAGTTLTACSSNGKIPSPSHRSQSKDKSPVKSKFFGGPRSPFHNGPILCEYTEPKDVQSHVYAELANSSSQTKPQVSKSVTSSPVKTSSVKPKQPLLLSHSNTITIAVPPPPISIPHSSSFHSSPRLLRKLRENELSSSNPAIASQLSTPVKIIHVNDLESAISKTRLSSEKLKRSQSNADASCSTRSHLVSPLLNDSSGNGISKNDTQKRPLPSIPSWPNQNEAKSQL